MIYFYSNLMEKQYPKVGVGVYILNNKNQLLLMLRKGGVGAGTWSPPGGHLEYGENFLKCARRESKEEVNLNVEEAELWAINNNIMSNPDRHYINIDFLVTKWSGEPQNMETEKCEKIGWFDLRQLPEPAFEPSANFFKNNPNCLCRSGKKFKDCHGK